MAQTVDISDEIAKEVRKFKLSNKFNAALIYKINKEKLCVELDEELENTNLEEVAECLPVSVPRFILYSHKYNHDDGRISYPLVFIFYCPEQISPVFAMLYTTCKTNFTKMCEVMKLFDVQNSETLSNEWLDGKLKWFK